MLNFNKKNELENANRIISTGLIGFLIRLFMGKDFMRKTSEAISKSSAMLDGVKKSENIAHNGANATAKVLSIKDTNATVNLSNYLVILGLLVTPEIGSEFEVSAQVLVPRIAVPRIGDVIRIKYNPEQTSEIVLV